MNAKSGFRKFFSFTALGILILATSLAGVWLVLPSLDPLERIEPHLITRIYDKDSLLLREFYSERRIWVKVDRVPELQIKAVTAIEDQNFFSHGGIDFLAIPASLLPALSGKKVRGGSTLTQQLAKLVFLGPERSLYRKVREILLAFRIERTYTKKEILELYLNQVYLGASAYGFHSAAERYFSLPLDSLSLSQQALLAGLLQRPEAFRPDRHPDQALSRRNTVLRAMAKMGDITAEQLKISLEQPLGLKMHEFESVSGNAAAYFMEIIRKELESRWGAQFLDSAGTRIYTTLDRKAQMIVDTTLTQHLQNIQASMNGAEPKLAKTRRAQGAVVVIENATGAVRALSGGLDWTASNFNRATMAVRSPGSAFKAIVYAAAMDKGASPGLHIVDRPIAIPDPDDTTKRWRPHNLDYGYEGGMTLRRAFYRSRNTPAIQVAMNVGLDTLVAYASRFGISRPIRPVPALALGACDVTPFEMTSAFSVFANGGERLQPRFIESIIDRNSVPVNLGEPTRTRVIGAGTAWIMQGMLRDVNIHGTAADIWANGFRYPSGGKTGTSNNYCDAWYIGFTKKYSVGVWIGTDDHQSLGGGHAGTDDAMPIWLDIMRALHKGDKVKEPSQDFPRPPEIEDIRICKLSGLAPQNFCDSVVDDFRVKGLSGPLSPCRAEIHRKAQNSIDTSAGKSSL